VCGCLSNLVLDPFFSDQLASAYDLGNIMASLLERWFLQGDFFGIQAIT